MAITSERALYAYARDPFEMEACWTLVCRCLAFHMGSGHSGTRRDIRSARRRIAPMLRIGE